MGNRAIIVNGHPVPHAVNGGVSDIAITTHGSNWYFVSYLKLISHGIGLKMLTVA